MSTTSPEVRFYSTTGEHGCFSNFNAAPFKLRGHTCRTSEHYFQAQKIV